MLILIRKIRLFSLITLMTVPTLGYCFSGAEYLQRCKEVTLAKKDTETLQQTVNRALNAGSCAGYVGGVINGINLVGNMLQQKKAMKKNFICLPQGIQANELVEKLIVYLQTDPQEIDAPVTLHIHSFFSKTYPCREPQLTNPE